MSKVRDEYYNGAHDSCCEYAEAYIKELEKEKAELIDVLHKIESLTTSHAVNNRLDHIRIISNITIEKYK